MRGVSWICNNTKIGKTDNMKMNNRKRCSFSAALACSAAAVAASYQTVSLVDIQAEIAAYAAKTNEAARLCAAYDKERSATGAPRLPQARRSRWRQSRRRTRTIVVRIELKFPAARAVDGCRVNEYEVTAVLVEDDVELLQAQRRMLSPDHYRPVSGLVKEVSFAFAQEDLPLRGRYRFEVRPIECFGKKGNKIVSSLTVI